MAERDESVRIDVWLWGTRVYKTRSQAATACRLRQVRIGGQEVKASRLVRPGDELNVEREGVACVFRVLQVLNRRVGAKRVPEFLEDLTPAENLEKAVQLRAEARLNRVYHVPGEGRPTKRDRREMEAFEQGWL